MPTLANPIRLASSQCFQPADEIERRLGLADCLATCLKDPRAPERVQHRLAEIIRFRMLMVASGYVDGNDADALRRGPMFKLALEPLFSDEELVSIRSYLRFRFNRISSSLRWRRARLR
jgi:hypothetical protein